MPEPRCGMGPLHRVRKHRLMRAFLGKVVACLIPILCSNYGENSARTAGMPLSSLLPAKPKNGGEGGIRTPDTVARMPHFECGAFNRSATSPQAEKGSKKPGSDARYLPKQAVADKSGAAYIGPLLGWPCEDTRDCAWHHAS